MKEKPQQLEVLWSMPEAFRLFPKFTPIQIGPSLEWYMCPVCNNRSNLRWMDQSGKTKVLGCNATCASQMLKVRANMEARGLS